MSWFVFFVIYIVSFVSSTSSTIEYMTNALDVEWVDSLPWTKRVLFLFAASMHFQTSVWIKMLVGVLAVWVVNQVVMSILYIDAVHGKPYIFANGFASDVLRWVARDPKTLFRPFHLPSVVPHLFMMIVASALTYWLLSMISVVYGAGSGGRVVSVAGMIERVVILGQVGVLLPVYVFTSQLT